MARTKIDVELTNASSTDVREAEIYFRKHLVFGEYCFVGKGYGKTYLDYPYVEGDTAEIEWTANGKAQKKRVNFSEVLPKHKSGTLIFTIHDDNVAASFKPKSKQAN